MEVIRLLEEALQYAREGKSQTGAVDDQQRRQCSGLLA